jgi:hypothetical protein
VGKSMMTTRSLLGIYADTFLVGRGRRATGRVARHNEGEARDWGDTKDDQHGGSNHDTGVTTRQRTST